VNAKPNSDDFVSALFRTAIRVNELLNFSLKYFGHLTLIVRGIEENGICSVFENNLYIFLH
jgi:hypothetical protein